MTKETFSEKAFEVLYDAEADAAYIWVLPENESAAIRRTVDVGFGVYLDLSDDDLLVGIELIGPGAAYRRWADAREAGALVVDQLADGLERLADS